MPTRRNPHAASARDLTELSAIMRAIAMERKGAALALRNMAANYEATAIGMEISDTWTGRN